MTRTCDIEVAAVTTPPGPLRAAPDPWFSVGQHVLVDGAGSGVIVEVGDGPKRYEGSRYYRVNFGPTRCHCCGREGGDRLEWALAMHITLTVGERKRLEASRV